MKLTMEQLRTQFWLDHPQLDRRTADPDAIARLWDAYYKMMTDDA